MAAEQALCPTVHGKERGVESTMHLSTVHLDRLQLQLKLEGVPRNVMSAADKDAAFYK